MMRLVMAVLLLISFAFAQDNGGKSADPAASAAPAEAKPTIGRAAETKTATSPAVITIKGLCGSSSGGAKDSAAKTGAAHKSPSADCKTVVTRKEFEELADAIPVPPASRKQFATWYATALIMSNEAHKRGLDRGQHYEELMRVTRMQVLAQQLAHSLQDESAKVSDQEIENYYHNNGAAYQVATLERLYIPRNQQQEAPKEKETEDAIKKRQADSEAAMKKEADDLRARAAAGEDFTKLQAEAYKFANFKASPPEVKMEKARRTSLPPSQATVFDMGPGTVSQVISDPAGYFVYKLKQKDTLPLDQARPDIQAALQKQRMQDAAQTMQESATPSFDEAYFASLSPAPPPSRGRGDVPVPKGMPAPSAPTSPSTETK